MLKKLIGFIFFFLVPLILMDYYTQHIASPVQLDKKVKSKNSNTNDETIF